MVTTPVVLLATITYGLFIVYDYHITEEKEKDFMIGLGLLILLFLVKAFVISFFDEKYISEFRSLFDNIMTGVISASLVALFRC
ncbi:MAG: hypothetical protein KBS60_02960 [Phascolarctobacterium sp.]|nr:hypothetical protein [Candidatus Phascolarctobacterium caballi]